MPNSFGLFGIVCVAGHYIVQTHEGLKKEKIIETNRENVRDEIRSNYFA